jgi:Leucine-rich repeat (LRR) protein
LTSLVSLNASGNDLRILPESIGNLTSLKDLNVTRNRLTKLPECIGDLELLEFLDVQFNHLEQLPERICDLKSLRTLTANDNFLSKLPERIGDLTSLIDLSLSSNQFTELPERIGDLTSLKSLYLHHNKLTKLPEHIGNLESLTSLWFSHNQLTELPESVAKLTSLEYVYSDDNPLTFLSEEIRSMPVFRKEPLSKHLMSLPTIRPPSSPSVHASAEEVFITTTSATLHVHSNAPDPLPLPSDPTPHVAQLLATNSTLNYTFPSATALLPNPGENGTPSTPPRPTNAGHAAASSISHPVTTRPVEGGWLPKAVRIYRMKKELHDWVKDGEDEERREEASERILACFRAKKTREDRFEIPSDYEKRTELRLGSLNLTTLPDCIGDLKSVLLLDVGSNRLEQLPDRIGDMTKLDLLDAQNNQLTTLPERIGDLKCRDLLLTDNQLTKLPERICDMEKLEELAVARNRLTELPEHIDKLGTLYDLRMCRNQLTKLPESIGNLRLHRLDVSSNQLTELPESLYKLDRLGCSIEVYSNPLTFLSQEIRNMRGFNIRDENGVNENEMLLSLPTTRPPSSLAADTSAEVVAIKATSTTLSVAVQVPDPLPPDPTPHAEHLLATNPTPTHPTFAKEDRDSLTTMQSMKDAIDANLITQVTTTPAAQHTDLATIATPPAQQPSLTPDQFRRLEQLLGADTPLQQVTFTPEDRAKVDALLSMQDAIESVFNQPAVTPGAILPREEMDKLIGFMQLNLEEGREKQQLAAELAALKADYPDTAKSGLLLYNLLSKTLIGLHNNAPQLTSGVANTGAGMASSKAAPTGVAISVLNIVPMVGNQLASATRAAFNSIDQNHVRQNLLRGLDAMASIDNAGTPLEQQATMQRLTHALVYRLALHHCAKPPSVAGKVTTAVKVAVGIDDRSISNYQNYAKKITDAILTSQRTFSGASVEVVVSHLLAAALTGATRSQDRARDKARLLGKKHQQIIRQLAATAGPVATSLQPIAVPTTTVRSLQSSSAWLRPTVAKLPDVIREMAIPEPPPDEPVTPRTQRLLNTMYLSSNEDKVRDAGDRLEARMQMKQVMQQNAQLRRTIDQLQADAPNPDGEQQRQQDAQRLQNEVSLLRNKVRTLERETGVDTSSDARLIGVLMPRPGQGRLVEGQDAQNAEVNARVDSLSEAIVELQDFASISRVPPPAPDPNEGNNRLRLFRYRENR